jgi:hypothetical protein
MNTIELTDEQIDVICQAINEAANSRADKNTDLDSQVAEAFDSVRKLIRLQNPINASLKKLMSESLPE